MNNFQARLSHCSPSSLLNIQSSEWLALVRPATTAAPLPRMPSFIRVNGCGTHDLLAAPFSCDSRYIEPLRQNEVKLITTIAAPALARARGTALPPNSERQTRAIRTRTSHVTVRLNDTVSHYHKFMCSTSGMGQAPEICDGASHSRSRTSDPTTVCYLSRSGHRSLHSLTLLCIRAPRRAHSELLPLYSQILRCSGASAASRFNLCQTTFVPCIKASLESQLARLSTYLRMSFNAT